MKTIKLLAIASAVFLMSSCGGEEHVTEAGTYKGKVAEVEADENEIHVTTDAGKDLELYFTDSTKLTKNGLAVEFTELKEDQSVEVVVTKAGDELNPVSVNIVE